MDLTLRLRWSAILVVAVEQGIVDVLRGLAAEHELRLIEVSTMRAAINAMRYEPDVVIAAEMTQDGSYQDFIVELRLKQSHTPVIVTLNRSTETRKVEIFEAGADDCIEISTGSAELLARIRRTLRRSPAFRVLPAKLYFDAVEIDTEKRKVHIDGKRFALTAKEYELLEILILYADRVITKDFICSRIWTVGADSQIVRFYIKRLRDKLGPVLEKENFIENVPGVGYRLYNHSLAVIAGHFQEFCSMGHPVA